VLSRVRTPPRHATQVWGQLDLSQGNVARALLASGMQTFYQMPFDPFERHSPYGMPAEVAEFVRPCVEAGCSAFKVIPCAEDAQTAIAAVGELQRLLT
jgi:hypothetical protein